jgi:hypothetical protein
MTLGSFQIFPKIHGNIASQGAPPVSMSRSTTPVADLPPVSTTQRQILPLVQLVLLIPIANLPPVANNGNNIRLLTP